MRPASGRAWPARVSSASPRRWGVQASARGERAVRRLTWVALVAAVAAAALAGQHHAVDDVLLWSGPWGWAVGPVALAAWPSPWGSWRS